jgi:ribosome-associated protein
MKALSTAPQKNVAPAKKRAATPKVAKPAKPSIEELAEILRQTLDDAKAEDVHMLDLAGKTALADFMIIATGGSDRHVNALAERIIGKLRELRYKAPRVEGMPVCDWVLIDTGDIILHLFRPEVRGFYNLEKLWGLSRPLEGAGEGDEPAPKAAARSNAE